MKKILSFIIAAVLCLSLGITAYAGDKGEEKPIDASQPRLMVTEYSIDGGSLSPSKEKKLTIKLKNHSTTKALKNIKLSILDESGELETTDMPTRYVGCIYAGSTYTWDVWIKASPTAAIGEHKLTVSSEYEDKYYNPYSGSDVITVNVRQTVGIDHSGIQLPVKLYPDDTTTMDISILNTGKSDIRNCRIDCAIDGLESGGATFVGEIAAGEQGSTSVNLRVGKELGDIAGKVTITYDDAFGKSHKKNVDVSSTIVEKPVETQEDTEDGAKFPFWWAFLAGGIVLGGGVGCAIPIAVYSRKMRKIDELRL